MRRLVRGVGALLVLLAMVVGAPLALWAWVGNPWPPGGWAEVQLVTNRTVYGLIAAVGWLAWAQMTGCILLEAVAATRGTVADRVRFAPGGQQQFARVLVTSIAALGIGAGTVAPASPPSAHAEPAAHAERAATVAHAVDDAMEPHRTGHGTAITVEAPTTVWRLADTHLGDGSRWREILDLNRGTRLGDGTLFTQATQTITRGTTLRLPDGAEPPSTGSPNDAPSEAYTVRPGDTLWDVSEAELGDPTRYPAIYRASADIEQPGGRRLTDPDHIEVGWRLTIPGATGRSGAHHPHQSPIGQPPEAPSPAPQAPSGPGVPGPQTPSAEPVATTERSPDTSAASVDEGGVSALRALLATAVCLSAGALGLVAVNRRRQLRQRRPGRTIAATPPELAALERDVVENGVAAQCDVEFLDRALRQVAACSRDSGEPLPQLGAAVLGTSDLTLLFTHPATAETPTGWTATHDTRSWTLPRSTVLDDELLTQPAPYPALVTIGQDEHERTWLLDLEAIGEIGIAGAPHQVADLTRFMVAELAVNAWSEGAEVLLAQGFGAETVELNPARLRRVERQVALRRAAAVAHDAAESERNLGTDLLGLRRDGELLDSTGPVVIVIPTPVDAEVADTIGHRDRSRVVVVRRDQAEPVIELRGDGTAYLPRWGTSIRAFTLPEHDAAAMAALIGSTRNLQDAPIPRADGDAGPVGRYARADGSLREELTAPRRLEGGDGASLLPGSDEAYLAATATTPADLAALAPSVPDATQAELEALDPTLDQDVADWFDPTSARPKVHLLGPIDVTATGGSREGIANLGGTIEFVVYLACQERGVTGERAAEAFGWKTVRTVQNRARDARRLLGTRPDGTEWLPEAGKTESARRGIPTYELAKGPGGVLISHDLFVRLRLRGQRRGDDGLDDLVTALSLVSGEPFDQLRRGGYGWLLEGQRHDQIMVGAIHDVAHVVATRALVDGRTDLVAYACEVARKASPDSDVPWLDLAAAAEAEGGRTAADELVREHVIDRIDEDLPARTEQVIDRRRWLTG